MAGQFLHRRGGIVEKGLTHQKGGGHTPALHLTMVLGAAARARSGLKVQEGFKAVAQILKITQGKRSEVDLVVNEEGPHNCSSAKI